MVVDKIGINFSALNNLNPINLSLPNTTAGMINEIPKVSNQITGGYLGLIILSLLFIYMLITLSDKTEFGGFRYSIIRAMGIASGMAGTVGILMVNIGYFTDFFHAVIFLTASLVCAIWVYIEER